MAIRLTLLNLCLVLRFVIGYPFREWFQIVWLAAAQPAMAQNGFSQNLRVWLGNQDFISTITSGPKS